MTCINTKIIPGDNKDLYLNNFYNFFWNLILESLKVQQKVKNYKVLITIFSIFSSLGIFLPPNLNDFLIYQLFPVCILHKNSIIYWIKKEYQLKKIDINSFNTYLFDSNNKNQIISFNTAFIFL